MTQTIGYTRVSTTSQELNSQIDALLSIGVKKQNIYSDKISGVKALRPGLEACFNALEKGDTLVVYDLSRLGRNLSHLLELVEELRQRGVKFKSLCDGDIDTTTATGEMFFTIAAAFHQYERKLRKEKTIKGLESARARGRVGGRKPLDPNSPKIRTAKEMHKNNALSINEICKTLEIKRTTFYRWLKK